MERKFRFLPFFILGAICLGIGLIFGINFSSSEHKKNIAEALLDKKILIDETREFKDSLVVTGGARLLRISKKIKVLNPEMPEEKLIEYSSYINNCIIRWGHNEDLIIAMIQLESGFDPLAKSPAGARGMMQIIPSFWKKELDLTEEKLDDPGINIWSGCKILDLYKAKYPSDYLDRYGGFEPGSGLYQMKLIKFLRKISWL